MNLFELQCGNLRFRLCCTASEAIRLHRGLQVLNREDYRFWDSLTPDDRAQYHADYEWLMAKIDQVKLSRLSGNR
jgi:hypothetical protein